MEEDKKERGKSIWGVVLVGIAILAVFYLVGRSPNRDIEESVSAPTPIGVEKGTDPLNTTYTIEGKKIVLVDGKAEETIPESATVIKTYSFGTPTYGGLNENEIEDAALILVQEPGGSGIFYYAVASIQDEDGWVGTNAEMLGDRIAPQMVEITADGMIIFNYADRPADAPMSETPSIGVSKYFEVEGVSLIETEKPSDL